MPKLTLNGIEIEAERGKRYRTLKAEAA